MKISIQLYDDNGCGCGMFYNDLDTIEELLKFLDYISDNGYYSYEIVEVKDNEQIHAADPVPLRELRGYDPER